MASPGGNRRSKAIKRRSTTTKKEKKMFRKLTDRLNSAADRLNSAAAAVLGTEDPNVRTLTAMGFDDTAAATALQQTGGDVDRAAELLLAQGIPATNNNNNYNQQQQQQQGDDDATLQRVMQESLDMEEERQNHLRQNPSRTAAVHKAGEAAMMRQRQKQNQQPKKKKKNPPRTTAAAGQQKKAAAIPVAPAAKKTTSRQNSLEEHHPDVKIIPKLQDKSKEEQILRCADRLKGSPQAVDTLYRALTTIRNNPDDTKFRKVDKTTVGYKRSLENVPGAEDLLIAMSFHRKGNTALVLERSAVDPALLYLGVTALEQTKLTEEYIEGKRKAAFGKAIQEIQMGVNSSTDEAIKRSQFMSKCPSEPPNGRGALMQVVMADETVRRRFDGDDTLACVLNWLGGHGSVIPEKILSREWSLVDLNRYPVAPIDCEKHQQHTLQYIGCWPSGKLEIVPSKDEWMSGSSVTDIRGSSRGLGSAPRDAL